MFQTAPGVTIPCPEKIKEEYQVYSGSIQANVGFDSLRPLVREFYQNLDEPLFFVLQVPLSQPEEEAFGDGKFHDKVMYLDGLGKTDVEAIFDRYGRILLEDGMSQFAVASHRSGEELFVKKYKLVDIYAPNPQKYIPLLERYGLTPASELITVWNTFSEEAPGECRRVTIDGMDIYAVAGALQQQGMYVAKVVES